MSHARCTVKWCPSIFSLRIQFSNSFKKDINSTIKRAQDFFEEYFKVFSEGETKKQWDLGVTTNNRADNIVSAYLCHNTGTGSLIRIIPSLLDYYSKKRNLTR